MILNIIVQQIIEFEYCMIKRPTISLSRKALATLTRFIGRSIRPQCRIRKIRELGKAVGV